MALFSQSRCGELYNLMRKDNPNLVIPFTPENVTVSAVTAIAGAKNTSALVTGTKYSGYRGSKTVKYNRLDLGLISKNLDFFVTVTQETPKDLNGILPFINAKLGIFLEEGDFTNQELLADLDTMYFSATLTVNAGHPTYIGSMLVKVRGYTVTLDEIVTNRELNVVKDPSPHVAGRFNQSSLTYGYDYTGIVDALKDIWVPGGWAKDSILTDTAAKRLAYAMASVDGLPWTSGAGVRAFNLRGATVLYDGPPITQFAGSANNPDPNFTYDRVLIVQTVQANCSNLANGNGWGLFIHYDLIKET